MKQFSEADFFLYLRSEKWYFDSSSIPYLSQPPQYLFEAKRKSTANQLLKPLSFRTVEEFREQLTKRLEELKRNFGIIWYASRFEGKLDPNEIGSS